MLLCYIFQLIKVRVLNLRMKSSQKIVQYLRGLRQISILVGTLHTLIDSLQRGMIRPVAILNVTGCVLTFFAGAYVLCFLHDQRSFQYLGGGCVVLLDTQCVFLIMNFHDTSVLQPIYSISNGTIAL